MSNGYTIEELKDMLENLPDGQLPEEINRRLLAIMIMTNTDSIRNQERILTESINKQEEKLAKMIIDNHAEVMKTLNSVDKKVEEKYQLALKSDEDLNNRVHTLEDDSTKYPTIIKWVSSNKKKAVSIFAGLVILSNIWFVSGLRFWFTKALLLSMGIPTELITEIMKILFN